MVRLRIKEVAEAKGYNMSTLSRKSNVDFKTIKRVWRNPYYGTELNTLDKIARALEVEIADLIESLPDQPA